MTIDIENRKNIVIVCTTAKMVRFFLVKHIEAFSKEYKVFVICNLNQQEDILDVLPDNVQVLHMPVKRNIDLFSDIKILLKLIVFLYTKKVSAIYSISPKGGFLCVLAAFISRIPVRVNTFTGQVWVTKKGVNRYMLKFLDKITSSLATVLIVDSQSQRKFLERQGVIKHGKAIVIEHGSISGVDTSRFFPNKSARSKVRSEMNTPDDSIVFLFVGRLKREKGVFDLFNAFTKVYKKTPGVELWFVGDDEENVQQQLNIFNFGEFNVKFIGYTTCPEKYMQAADIYCLTSYREGFGLTVIEAAACKIPAIGSNIYGLTDAIIDKKSGFLVNVGDVDDIAFKMLELSEDKLLRDRMGQFAYKNALDKFDANKITSQLFFLFKKNIDKSDEVF